MTTTPDTERKTLRIGHSPDPDDAFMWYPLANFTGPDGQPYTPKIDTKGYDFVHVLEDIQSLNERSNQGELEITALSIHQLPYIADQYVLTSCGSSMGDGYGPMVVAREKLDIRDFIHPLATPTPADAKRPRLAIPGERTSAWLAMQLLLLEHGAQPGEEIPVDYEVVPFDQIIPRVVAGEFDAGLIIHEGQLTYANAGLQCIVDLGKWWTETRELPLPLGGNAIRKDLGDRMPEICGVLLESIRWALNHREESVQFSLNWARDMGHDLADRFVGMYVNQWTLDYGDHGRAAVKQFIGEAVAAGLVPDKGEIAFVEPG
ncbi:MAG: MqnA/MqnD/SBP family protein [Phycisphaeraceae bacterium]